MRTFVTMVAVVLLVAVGAAIWWWSGRDAQPMADRSAPAVMPSPVTDQQPPRAKEAGVEADSVSAGQPVQDAAAGKAAPEDQPEPSQAAAELDTPRTSEADDPPRQQSAASASTLSQQPLPLEQLCFQPVSGILPTADQYDDWFAPVAGHAGSVKEARLRDGKCMVLDGVHRLVVPWAERTVLRVMIHPDRRWRLYFYRGQEGVALHWDVNQATMVAYVVSRHPQKVQPYRYQLAASDLGRVRRATPRPPVPVDFRYQDRELIVSCGDIAMLRAPMPGVPEDVYWDGRAEVHGLALTPSPPFPTLSPDKPAAVDVLRPAELMWTGDLPDTVSWKTTDQGAVVLTADNASSPGWIAAPLPRCGLQLVDVRLSHITPGTAVCLAPESGSPGVAIRFVQDRHSKRICAVMSHNANETSRTWKDPSTGIVPFIGQSIWIRFACGPGVLRWWLSCDGRNWADVEPATTGMNESATRIGLQYASGDQRHIQLDQLAVRPLASFLRLIPPALRDAALTPPRHGQLQDWMAEIQASQPAGVSTDQWQRAMAVRTLELGCDATLSWALINRLLDDPHIRQSSVDERIEFVQDVALLMGQPGPGDDVPTIWARFVEIGRDAWWRNEGFCFTTVRRAMMHAMVTRHHQPRWDFADCIRPELLALLGESEWQQLQETIRILDFYRLAENQPLLEWARHRLNRQLGLAEEPVNQKRHVFSWQTPYAEELSREAYNAVVELHSLVATGSWQDAARSIGNARLDRISGLTPSQSDNDLRLSPRVAVQATMTANLELARQMEQQFGQLARLRIRQAIAQGDDDAVRQAVDQFVGTSAAAEGRVWLGDLQLARGNGITALAFYQQSLRHAPGQISDPLVARMALASALSGKRAATDVRQTVEIGSRQLTPEQLSGLVEALLAQNVAAKSDSGLSLEELPPRNLERQFLPWCLGERTDQSLIPGIEQLQVDWPGRQICAVRHADTLLVSNRFDLLALDAHNLKVRWSSPLAAEKWLPAQDWGLIPMRPLVRGSTVVCRQLAHPQPAMVGCDLKSGEVLWVNQNDDRIFASDPFEFDDRLACLTVTRRQQFVSTLELIFLDEADGQVEQAHEVLKLRDSWWIRRCCEVLVAPECIVIVLGGVVAAIDPYGRVMWVRQSESVPIEADLYTVRQHFQSAKLAGARLLVAQPGVPSIECLDPDSGALVWRQVLPDIEQILTADQDAVVVRLRRHIASFQVESGALLWRRSLEDQLTAASDLGRDGLLVSRAVQPDADRNDRCPQLLLLDGDTGQTLREWTLPALAGQQPQLGPLLVVDDRLLAFWADGQRTANRELILISPP